MCRAGLRLSSDRAIAGGAARRGQGRQRRRRGSISHRVSFSHFPYTDQPERESTRGTPEGHSSALVSPPLHFHSPSLALALALAISISLFFFILSCRRDKTREEERRGGGEEEEPDDGSSHLVHVRWPSHSLFLCDSDQQAEQEERMKSQHHGPLS
jgi:hypothetical protein